MRPDQLVGSSQKICLLLVEPLLSQGDINMDTSLLIEVGNLQVGLGGNGGTVHPCIVERIKGQWVC